MRRHRYYSTNTDAKNTFLGAIASSFGNPWFLHVVMPLAITANGVAAVALPSPHDSYLLPAVYWIYSLGCVPLVGKTKPFKGWRASMAIHIVNGFIYSAAMAGIYREQSKLSNVLKATEELELTQKMLIRDKY